MGLHWNNGKENANYRDYRVPIVTLRPLKVVDPQSCGLCISHGMGGASQGSMITESISCAFGSLEPSGNNHPYNKDCSTLGSILGAPIREVTI